MLLAKGWDMTVSTTTTPVLHLPMALMSVTCLPLLTQGPLPIKYPLAGRFAFKSFQL